MASDSPYSFEELVLAPWVGLACGAAVAVMVSSPAPLDAALVWRAVLGGVCGWLYALCQQRCSILGYVLVGLSYGILLWILARLGLGLASLVVPLSAVRPSIGSFLIVTESLAVCSIVTAWLGGSSAAILPKD